MAGLPTLGLPHGALKKRTSHVLMKRTCRVSTTEESAPSLRDSCGNRAGPYTESGLPTGVPPAGAGGAPAGLAVCALNAPPQGQYFSTSCCESCVFLRMNGDSGTESAGSLVYIL